MVVFIAMFALLIAVVGMVCMRDGTGANRAETSSHRLVEKQLYFDTGKLFYTGQVRPGKWGTIHYAGSWIPHGKGKMYYFEGGLYYVGDVKSGWRDGKGNSYSADGRLEYSGYWKNDSPYVPGFASGRHVIYFADGKTKYYEGEWKNGVREGRGSTYYYDGGKEHDGSYLDGRRDGEGTYYNRDGSVCYQGMFKSGVPYGYGTVTDKKGSKSLEEQYKVDYLDFMKSLFQKI